jgi:hypothetical protein
MCCVHALRRSFKPAVASGSWSTRLLAETAYIVVIPMVRELNVSAGCLVFPNMWHAFAVRRLDGCEPGIRPRYGLNLRGFYLTFND